jgi:pimeloyl-ACP methyl ester carboxylesterase
MQSLFQSKKIFITSILFLSSFLFPLSAHAATYLGGYVRDDTTLDPSITYVMDGPITIFAGATLTIPAGTNIVITPGSTLSVFGNLVATGTPSNHISITGGVAPVFIPGAQPLTHALVAPIAIDPDTTQSPEVPGPVTAETPDTQSPDIAPFTISAGTDMPANTKYAAIFFANGSTAALDYLDIDNAATALQVGDGAQVTLAHSSISDSDTGVLLANGGNAKLTSDTFSNVTTPADVDFHATFAHSNSTFTDSILAGWQVGGDMLSGDVMKLNSIDGTYSLSDVNVTKDAELDISPGVTVFVHDGHGVEVDGTLSARGTNDKPITIVGDGICPNHSPAFHFSNDVDAAMEHVNFSNLCSGIAGTHATLTLLTDDFETVAGPGVSFDASNITATGVTMHDIYQGIKMTGGGSIKISNSELSLINGASPAIDISGQVPLTISASSVSGASICLGISQNSALVGDNLGLSDCAKVAIESDNSDSTLPTGITLTDSEISHSGIALELTKALVLNVSNNKFHDDTVGVSLASMPTTTIINNDWGSDNGPTIASNPGGDGDSIVTSEVPDVIYRPWIGMKVVEHDPIIIVPGITGSVLTKGYDDHSELWPNITKLALSPTDSFLNDLELLQGGTPSTVRPIVVGDIIRKVDTTDVFSSMISSLEQNGYTEGTDLFVLPYDWRLSNATNQALLKDAIAHALDKSGKSKVNIIAHSMGGLLVEDYLAQNADVPIDHLFYIGVPHLGAPKAFQTLMYGDDMGFKFSLGSALQVPLLDPNRVKTISQNMPSVYELLPSQKYIDKFGSYVRDLTRAIPSLNKADTESYMTDDGRNAKMFPFAQSLHDATDNLDESKYSAYDFVGCGSTNTASSYAVTKKQSLTLTGLQLVPEHRIYYSGGDGVVPIGSANAGNNALNYYVTSGSHGTLPSVPDIQNAIIDILNGNDVKSTATLSSGAQKCGLPGEIVEVHSPVTIDIYDSQGRHTGPTASGDIEYGIPNVQYDMIGDEKFAFLPDGPVYTIVNHAQAIGSYDMYVSETDQNNTVQHELYFNNVPLETTKATGTFTVNASGNYKIKMDSDGDGVTDSIIAPSSILAGYQAADVTPPTTFFKLDGSTVTLSADDDLSGVLNTKYSTDNVHWNIYTAPFQVDPGSIVYFLSIDNAGNTESIQQKTIPGNQTETPPADTTTTTPPPDDTNTPPADTTPPAQTQTTTTINNTTINNTTITNVPSNNDAPQNNPDDTQNDSPVTDTDVPPADQQTPPDDSLDADTPDQDDSAPALQSQNSSPDTETDSNSAATDTSSNDAKETIQENSVLLASAGSVVPLKNKPLILGMIIAIITGIVIFIKKRR